MVFIFGGILSMRKSRYTAEQMLAAVKMADAGTPVADVCPATSQLLLQLVKRISVRRDHTNRFMTGVFLEI